MRGCLMRSQSRSVGDTLINPTLVTNGTGLI